jgi:hypothetical protein
MQLMAVREGRAPAGVLALSVVCRTFARINETVAGTQ